MTNPVQDNTLPHLPTALDTAVMQTVFQESLFWPHLNDRFCIATCQIERVRYKPGQNCLVCYRLQIEDTVTREVCEQLVTTRLYQRGGSYSRFNRAQKEPLAFSPLVQPLLHLPHLDMVAWVFPNDRKLQGLPQLTNTAYLQNMLLPPLMSAHIGRDGHITDVSQTVAHYNPEHTCMVRVQVQMEHARGERQLYTLYGKTYDSDEGATTYRVMNQLWEYAARANGRFHMAKPLGYNPELHLLWQRGLTGQTLQELEMDSSEFCTGLEQAATAVAAFHQALILPPLHPAIAWTTRLVEMRTWLPAVNPFCQPILEPLLKQLLAQANELEPQPIATLHGDLHLQNFFLNEGAVALVDLDNVCVGSPWQDVGSFIASLLYRGLLLETPDTVTWETINTFYRAYGSQVSWHTSPAVLRWFIAAALINERAFRCVTRLKNGRLNLVDQLVTLATQIVADKGPL